MFACKCIQRPSLSQGLRRSLNRIIASKEGLASTSSYSHHRYGVEEDNDVDCARFNRRLNYNLNFKRFLQTSLSFFNDDYQIVRTPPFAESITEGDVRWEKDIGDVVEADEVIGEIETDKTALPIVSPASGVIVEYFVEDGGRVEKNDQLFKLQIGGSVAAPPQSKPEIEEESVSPSPSPSQRSLVKQEEKSLQPDVAGKAPKEAPQTQILSGQQPIEIRQPTSTPPPPTPSNVIKEVKEAPSKIFGSRNETKVKMNRMRQRISQRLKDAQNINAMLTTFNEIDMSNAIKMRNQYKDIFLKKHNLKLGFMSPFVKASSVALEQLPTVNAVIEDGFVIYRDFVDISVAVATPKGLVVPVLRDVNKMNFADIEKGMNDLGEKARSGNLAIEDMDGGTFTISNGGVFGSLMGTPIINPPQSAILGMHGIFDRPVAMNGKVEIRPMMYVALTYDHRLIDGREAVTFLRKIKQNVEDPAAMFLDL